MMLEKSGRETYLDRKVMNWALHVIIHLFYKYLWLYSLILQIPVNVYNEKKSCWAWGYTG